MDCLSARAGSNPVVTADNMARSSNGSGCETLTLVMRVRLPYGLLNMAKWRNWDTRGAQNAVPVRACEFDSRLGYFIADAAGAQLAFIRPVSPARYRGLQLAGGPAPSGAS